MKNKILISAISSIFFTLLYSCQDFIEVDLAKKSIIVLAPANNTASSSSSQLFWWEELKGADKYNLQIVKPGFSAVQQLILDSTITNNQFSYSLLPGVYQWRVRAMNNSSYTQYITYNLTIDSSLDLSSQWVSLMSPADNYSSNNYTHAFAWQSLMNADSYLFQILLSGSVISTQTLATTTANYTFIAEGSYQWRVLAQNSNSTSLAANATRNISIDNTPPTAPVLTLPTANDTVSNPVNLEWTPDVSATMDSVFVYADTNLTVLVTSILTTNFSFSFTGTIGQDYFWRVRSRDAAGNWSAYATRRKFIIAP